MSNKFAGDEKQFAEKYGLGQRAGEYAIHGGGVPVRVKGVGSYFPNPLNLCSSRSGAPKHCLGTPVPPESITLTWRNSTEGLVAVCVVSGLKQHEDHGVVIEAMEAYIKEMV